MTIIVEDGSIVDGANSYISLADARLLLANYGQDLNDNTAQAEIQLLQAMSYIEAYRAKFKGFKVLQTQPLQWPRAGVCIDDWIIDSDTIPQELINAQVYGAYEIQTGEELQANSDGLSIQSEEVVGAVKSSYYQNGSIEGSVNYVRVNDELNVLLNGGGSRGSVRGIRG
jgi:hypothetical protein